MAYHSDAPPQLTPMEKYTSHVATQLDSTRTYLLRQSTCQGNSLFSLYSPDCKARARIFSATSIVLRQSRNGEVVTSFLYFNESINSRLFARKPPEINN